MRLDVNQEDEEAHHCFCERSPFFDEWSCEIRVLEDPLSMWSSEVQCHEWSPEVSCPCHGWSLFNVDLRSSCHGRSRTPCSEISSSELDLWSPYDNTTNGVLGMIVWTSWLQVNTNGLMLTKSSGILTDILMRRVVYFMENLLRSWPAKFMHNTANSFFGIMTGSLSAAVPGAVHLDPTILLCFGPSADTYLSTIVCPVSDFSHQGIHRTVMIFLSSWFSAGPDLMQNPRPLKNARPQEAHNMHITSTTVEFEVCVSRKHGQPCGSIKVEVESIGELFCVLIFDCAVKEIQSSQKTLR